MSSKKKKNRRDKNHARTIVRWQYILNIFSNSLNFLITKMVIVNDNIIKINIY